MAAQKHLGSAGAPPGREQSKRAAPVGKRKLGEAEAAAQRGARAQLRPADAAQLEWLAQQDALAFMWHFADGSTSARPYLGGAAAACAKDAFDPYTQPEVVGCSLYSDAGGGAAVHFDLRKDAGRSGGGGGGGGGGALLEAAWLAVARLLCGEAQAVLVVPNAQLVLRTLLLALPALRPGLALEELLCDAAALDVSRWVDPVALASP